MVRCRARQSRLDVARRVVAEISRKPAAKTRQPSRHRHLEALVIRVDEGQWVVAGAFDDCVVLQHLGHAALDPQEGARRQADERVAAETLAADDGLEQKAVAPRRAVRHQLQVERQRGFQVGQRLGGEGDAVVALPGQVFKLMFGHARLRDVAAHSWCGTRGRFAGLHAGQTALDGQGGNRRTLGSGDGQGECVPPGPSPPVSRTRCVSPMNEHGIR
ncbi:hypothetical protein GALL_415990 [mine drainage metagenome]|uniref:Uncharacterized protein n=1 Tax=mine drainage metagenome TaxID=410659 RepID=A0A1J5Q0C3_9ZZZZ